MGNSSSAPNSISDDERLGREVFDSRKANRAQRGRFELKIFREKPGIEKLSVDRIDQTPLQVITEIADQNGTNRTSSFKGWVAVTAACAKSVCRGVEPDPLMTNAFHANILLPDDIDHEDQDALDTIANALAASAEWVARWE